MSRSTAAAAAPDYNYDNSDDDEMDLPVIAIDHLRAIVRPDQVRNRREHVSGLVIREPAEPLFELDEKDPILQFAHEEQKLQQAGMQTPCSNETARPTRGDSQEDTASGVRETASATLPADKNNDNTSNDDDKNLGIEQEMDMEMSESSSDEDEVVVVVNRPPSQQPTQKVTGFGQESMLTKARETSSKSCLDSKNGNLGDEEELDMEISHQNADDTKVLLVANPPLAQQPAISAKAPQDTSNHHHRHHHESSTDNSEIAASKLPLQDHQEVFLDERPVVSSPATTNSSNTSESSSKSPKPKPKDWLPTSDDEAEYLNRLVEEIYLAEEHEFCQKLDDEIVRAEQQEQLEKENRQDEQAPEWNQFTQLRKQNDRSKKHLRVIRYYPRFLPGMSKEFFSRADIQNSLDTINKDYPEERPRVTLQESEDHDTWKLEVRGLKGPVESFLQDVDLSVRHMCLSCARAKLKSDGCNVEVRIKRSEKLGARMKGFRDSNDQEVGLLLRGHPEGQLSRLIGQEASSYGALLLAVNGEPCGSISDFMARIANTEEYQLTLRVSREASLSSLLITDKMPLTLGSSKQTSQESSHAPSGYVLRQSGEIDTAVEQSDEDANAKETPASHQRSSAGVSDGAQCIALNDVSEPFCSRSPVATNIEMEQTKCSTSKTASAKNARERPIDDAVLKPPTNNPPLSLTSAEEGLEIGVRVSCSEALGGSATSQTVATTEGSASHNFESVAAKAPGTSIHTPALPLTSAEEGVEIGIRVSCSEVLGGALSKLTSHQFDCHLGIQGKPGSQMERLVGKKALSSIAGVVSVEDKVVRDIDEYKAAAASASSGYYHLKLVFPVDADLTGADKKHVIYGPKKRSAGSVETPAHVGFLDGDGANKRKTCGVSLSAPLDNVAVPRKKSRNATNISLIGQLEKPDKKRPPRGSSDDSSSRLLESLDAPVQSLAGGASQDDNSGLRQSDTGRKKAKKSHKLPGVVESRMTLETLITKDKSTRTATSTTQDAFVRRPSLLTEESKRERRPAGTKNVAFSDDIEEQLYSPLSPVSRLRASGVKESEMTRSATDKVGLESCRQTYMSLEQAVQDGTPRDVIACISREVRGDSPTEKDLQRMREVVKGLTKKASGTMEKDFILKEKLLKILINTSLCVRQSRFMKNWERFDIRFEGIEGLRLKVPTCVSEGSKLSAEVFCMQEKVEKLHNITPTALLFDESTSSYRTKFDNQDFPYHMNYNPVLTDDRQIQVDLQVVGGTVPVQLGLISLKMSQLHKECPPDKKWKNIVVQASPTNAMYGAAIKISACRATMDRAVLEEKRSLWLRKLDEKLDWINRWKQEYLSRADADNNTKLTADIKVSDNLTLLHASVFLQDYRMVEKVLQSGADPSAKSGVGSALSLARNMADGMVEDMEDGGSTGKDDAGTYQKAGGDWKRSRREKMEKIVALLRDYSRHEVGQNLNDEGRSEDQSNESICTTDLSPKKVGNPSSSLGVELPLLPDPSWLTEDKKKNSFCRDWEKKHRCGRDTRMCKFIHLHRPWGARLSELLKSSKGYPLPDFDPNDIHLLERSDSSCRMWFTAGYSNSKPYSPGGPDKFDQFVYYSEGGETAQMSVQGVSWYPTQEHALRALHDVMIASAWAYQHGITPPDWESKFSFESREARSFLSVSAHGRQNPTDPGKPVTVGYYGPSSNGTPRDSISYGTARRSSDLGYYGPSVSKYPMEVGRDQGSYYGPPSATADLDAPYSSL